MSKTFHNDIKDDKPVFLFGKKNYIFMAIGIAVILLGFLLMTGPDANTRPDGNFDPNYWNDNIYSMSGTVTGVLTDSGFDILLSGRYFEARMRVVSNNCEQSVTVVPERKTEMKELAAVLKKC